MLMLAFRFYGRFFYEIYLSFYMLKKRKQIVKYTLIIVLLLYLFCKIQIMENLLSALKISVPDKIFIKDPETSVLGKKIIEQGIQLIDEIGFEAFTFKKLGAKISSNESSIYRYFESKHKLLLYLSSWYWAWIEYQLVIETFSISNADEKLEKAIDVVTRNVKEDDNFLHINKPLLYNIIINESSKSFLTKEVDSDNKKGYFEVYKRVITRISNIILEVNKKYPFALSLASTIVIGSLHQHYLKSHFPLITNYKTSETPTNFFIHLVKATIK